MIKKLQEKIGQTLITTHYPQIINARNEAYIYPIFSERNLSLIELLQLLDDTQNKNYILVEGLYDINWVKKAVQLLGKS